MPEHAPLAGRNGTRFRYYLVIGNLEWLSNDLRPLEDTLFEGLPNHLAVAFPARFLPAVRHVKAALVAGTLGEVLGARVGNRGRLLRPGRARRTPVGR